MPVMTDTDNELLTIEEAAVILKKSEYTVARWFREGKFPSAVKVGASWFIKRSDLYKDLEGMKKQQNQQ
jgi:excisionase family DNA binding protein